MSDAIYQNYIANAFVDSEALIEVHNPANGQLLGRVPQASDAQVEQAIAAARQAQKGWATRPAIERAGYLRKIASKVRDNAERLARIITAEQGKVLGLALVEVNFTADYLDYMAEWARRLEGEVLTSDRAGESIFLLRKPLGVVAGILPWNFPFFLIARKMAPALLTGNTIVIKPSEETPNNCFEFAKLEVSRGGRADQAAQRQQQIRGLDKARRFASHHSLSSLLSSENLMANVLISCRAVSSALFSSADIQ